MMNFVFKMKRTTQEIWERVDKNGDGHLDAAEIR